MPLALVVQPLALLEPGEEPVQVVDFGESGPIRCGRCKAYLNPFMRFVEGGRRFQCNLCAFVNECPREYMCNLGPDGRRQDCLERPELCKGSVEYVAPEEYMVRPPMPPAFFFCVDVTHAAVTSGATAAVCSSISRTLGSIPGGERTLVGLLTFDSCLHFYNLNTASGQPQMLVVGETSEPYAPCGNGLLVELSQARPQLEELLAGIPNMFASSCVPGAGGCAGAVVSGATQAMKATGGKILVFQTSMCTTGLGALKAREGASAGPVGSADDKHPLRTTGPAEGAKEVYRKLAQEAADFQVCVDLFLLTQGHVDLSSMAALPRTTGGQIYHYHPFNFNLDTAQLYNDLHWNLVRPQGMEAVMRVRCSAGLSVSGYSGAFTKHTATDLDLPAIDCNKAFVTYLRHDDKLAPDGLEACVQCALLYTTVDGQRRIRVHTLSLPCTNVLGNLFRSADLDAQMAANIGHVATALLTGNAPLAAMRESCVQKCVNMLYSYRKFCATTSSSGQLILPEALKLLPLYTLAVQKCSLLRSDTPADARAVFASNFLSLSAAFVVPRVYPRLFAVHALKDRDARDPLLPTSIALLSEKLDNQGIFLLENASDLLVWVGRQAPDELVQELFSAESVNDLQSGTSLLTQGEGPNVAAANAMVNEIRRQRCSFMRTRVVKRGDPLEVAFFNSLVEDRLASGMSYVEFLCHIHRQIQNKFN